ncbi:MAG: Ldh family oxidoreductase, partial [Thiotrichales bacterium]|nr:Ldh family oxidoreductase [Thiotrichales bacterium]
MSGDTNAAVRRENGQVCVEAPAMERLVGAIFERAGCDAEEARRIAWRLTGANLRGHDSHGVLRTRRYVEWLQDGRGFPGRDTTAGAGDAGAAA